MGAASCQKVTAVVVLAGVVESASLLEQPTMTVASRAEMVAMLNQRTLMKTSGTMGCSSAPKAAARFTVRHDRRGQSLDRSSHVRAQPLGFGHVAGRAPRAFGELASQHAGGGAPRGKEQLAQDS